MSNSVDLCEGSLSWAWSSEGVVVEADFHVYVYHRVVGCCWVLFFV